ncbi:M20 family metallo-hydrolase [Granulicella sp. 5B5]|uniref:M20 family metallo-hydrolase n=1 Tax=Granulicella sp. 5B5 TaxID=1617967 RepID=UPI0015F4B67B|nr:M20 family metallo-hydrolase [Granulicella sp. 5B5]
MQVTINSERLLNELHHLATLTDCPPATDPSFPAPAVAVTRIVFTPRDLEARAWLISLAQAAGFQTRVDPVGNIFIRWPGSDEGLGVVGTGSHTDAIPHAGMYDGTVGVLGGLEALRSLKEYGFIPKRTLELLMFTSEEPTRFGIGCLGSRLLGGVLSPAKADALPDLISETELGAPSTTKPGAPSSPAASSQAKVGSHDARLTLHDVRTAAGFTGPLTDVPLPIGYYHAWVELHIEQGPLLEREMKESALKETGSVLKGTGFSPSGGSRGLQAPEKSTHEDGALAPEESKTILGIVTHIAAPASYRFIVEGHGGHAGALLMPDRRDALTAASEIILSVERHTLAANAEAKLTGESGVDSVATVGAINVHPGAVNSVPSRVTLMLDIRDTDPERREHTMSALRADIAEIQSRRGVRITEERINADTPAISADHLVSTLTALCDDEHIPYKKMVSRAYHDTNFMARIAPVAMLFIPCRNGVSHRPDEYATPESITLGTRILARALAQLANE